jgi:hypothetical protein
MPPGLNPNTNDNMYRCARPKDSQNDSQQIRIKTRYAW